MYSDYSTDTRHVGVIDDVMKKDHDAKHRADIDKAPAGSVVTTITKKRGPDQFKTVWFKETHVKHVPIMHHMPVYTHVIKGVPVPLPAEPPPPVPPPPPSPPPAPLQAAPRRPAIKTIPVYKTIRVKTYKHVLTDETDPEMYRQDGYSCCNDQTDLNDRDWGVRVSGSKWDKLGGHSDHPSHRRMDGERAYMDHS